MAELQFKVTVVSEHSQALVKDADTGFNNKNPGDTPMNWGP